MTAVTKDLFIEQGATFQFGFNWHRESATEPGTPGDPYDITGCIVRMQVRKSQQSPAIIDASTTNGKIVVNGPQGRVDVTLSDDDTDMLTLSSAKYDLEIEFTTGPDAGVVRRLLQGTVTVSPNITQESDDAVVGA